MNKLSLYYHTIKYLKCRQVFYFIWYRSEFIKKLRLIISFLYPKPFEINYRFLKIPYKLYVEDGIFNGSDTFIFLNKTYTFNKTIDWNYLAHGKFWNYHLQYLDILNDDNFSIESRIEILKSISIAILDKKLMNEPYPVSIRLQNTISFVSKNEVRDSTIQKAIAQQFYFLRNNLEFHLDGNHLLENYISLCLASVYFETQQEKCFNNLLNELQKQLCADGAHYERSHMYHRQILFKLCWLYIVLKHNTKEHKYVDKLAVLVSQMYAYINLYTNKGKYNSRMQDSCERVGPSYFEIEELWAKTGIRHHLPHQSEQGNYSFWNWNNVFILINTGDIQPNFQPGHSHADIFNYELYYKEKPIIVDTGISTYEDSDRRRVEKQTSSHNTVEVQGESQAEHWGAFRLARRSFIRDLHQSTNEISATLHKNWGKSYTHYRQFSKKDNSLVVEDSVERAAINKSISYIHFHPDCEISLENEIVIIRIENAELQIKTLSSVNTIEEYKFAENFNKLKTAKRVKMEFEKKMMAEISWK